MTTETTTSRLSASKVAGTHRWRVYAGLDSATAIPCQANSATAARQTSTSQQVRAVSYQGAMTLRNKGLGSIRNGSPFN